MELTKDGAPRILAWDKDGTAYYPIISANYTPQSPAPSPSSALPLLRTPADHHIYLSTGGGHWIDSVSNDGKIITLEDNSIWEVSLPDQIDTTLWLPITDIVVTESENPSYPYRLINKDDSETAEAKLLSD
jgi:hypothetical protein